MIPRISPELWVRMPLMVDLYLHAEVNIRRARNESTSSNSDEVVQQRSSIRALACLPQPHRVDSRNSAGVQLFSPKPGRI